MGTILAMVELMVMDESSKADAATTTLFTRVAAMFKQLRAHVIHLIASRLSLKTLSRTLTLRRGSL